MMFLRCQLMMFLLLSVETHHVLWHHPGYPGTCHRNTVYQWTHLYKISSKRCWIHSKSAMSQTLRKINFLSFLSYYLLNGPSSGICYFCAYGVSCRYGLTFIPKQENLRENTFISAEAVAWMIKSVDGCQNKVDAVALGLVGLMFYHLRDHL